MDLAHISNEGKIRDPSKTGKFGNGFRSIHHITGNYFFKNNRKISKFILNLLLFYFYLFFINRCPMLVNALR
jgi:hypothetical protein